MQITTVSDFRKDIKTYLDRVVKNFETLIINRGKDSGIVVMSLQEYNSLMATNHELSSRKNELRLDSAIEKLKNKSKKQVESINSNNKEILLLFSVVGQSEQLTCPRCKSTNILNPDKDNDAQCIECAFIWAG